MIVNNAPSPNEMPVSNAGVATPNSSASPRSRTRTRTGKRATDRAPTEASVNLAAVGENPIDSESAIIRSPAPHVHEPHHETDFVSLKKLLNYLKPADLAKVEAAFAMAKAAHEGQTRNSGEPYITHPLAVTTILAEWHLDPQALIAAMLHDVVEDTPTTKDEIAKKFGKAVAELVDGV